MMRPGWQLLASPRLGALLLALLALAAAAGGSLPQSERLAPAELDAWQASWPLLSKTLDWLGLSRVYASGWFAVLCAALGTNLLAAMAVHGARMLAWLRGEAPPTHRMDGTGALPQGLARHFAARDESRRQEFALFGVPLLHLGFVMLVAGVALNTPARFGAHLELSEGEIYAGQPDKLLLETGSDPVGIPDFRLRLDRLHVDLEAGKHLTGLRADITLRDKEGVYRDTVEVNRPHAVGPYAVYLDKNIGHTAVFDRLLPDGRHDRLLVNFLVSSPAGWKESVPLQRDEIVELDSQPILYRMVLTPGDRPAFQLEARQRGKVVFNGRLAPGESADLGAYRLSFLGTVPWAGLYLSADPYLGLVFAGMASLLAGTLLQLLFHPRRMRLRRDGEAWRVEGWALRDDWRFARQWREWEQAR